MTWDLASEDRTPGSHRVLVSHQAASAPGMLNSVTQLAASRSVGDHIFNLIEMHVVTALARVLAVLGYMSVPIVGYIFATKCVCGTAALSEHSPNDEHYCLTNSVRFEQLTDPAPLHWHAVAILRQPHGIAASGIGRVQRFLDGCVWGKS